MLQEIVQLKCIEYIPKELDILAQSISQGSHVSIRVNYLNMDGNLQNFYMSESDVTIGSTTVNFEYPEQGSNAYRCISVGDNSHFDIDPTNLYPHLNSLVIAESYIRYLPIVPYIPLFWLAQDSDNDHYQVGDGESDVYICDQTIL